MEINSIPEDRVSNQNIIPQDPVKQDQAPESADSSEFDLNKIFNPQPEPEDEQASVEKSKNSFWQQRLSPNWDAENTTFENVKLNYPHWFNIATVGLHSLGGTLPSIPFIPKNLSLGFRNIAESFSRWCVPFSKLHNCIEALQGKRLYEAIARLPSLLIPILRLPFHNFQLAYGLGSGINVVHEHIKSRVGGLSSDNSLLENAQKINKGFVHAVRDLIYGGDHVETNERAKLGLTLGGGAAMILGAVPTLLFDKNGLNDTFARIFGSIRSLGGLLGDLSITIFPSHEMPELRKKEPIIGSLYLVPTFMDFAQRWMQQEEETNSIFNHIKTALNTIAELIWTHFSTIENQRAKEQARAQASTETVNKVQNDQWLEQAHVQPEASALAA